MVSKTIKCIVSLLLFTPFSGYSAQSVSDYPVAGTTPWQRPEGAPVIEWVQHDRSWYETALTGISKPYPRSLWFLDNQGDWYTPFTHREMTPPYDIRGWY